MSRLIGSSDTGYLSETRASIPASTQNGSLKPCLSTVQSWRGNITEKRNIRATSQGTVEFAQQIEPADRWTRIFGRT